MKRAVLLISILSLAAGWTWAAPASKTGILIDSMCGEMSAKNAEKVEGHKVACSLMPNCQQSGFGIVAEGKFYKFDDSGDKKALDILKKTRKVSKLEVKVTGEVEGESIKVSSIEEVE